MSTEGTLRPVTTLRLAEMKSRGEKITMLTAYDYTMARILDRAGIDVILVGDSAANVMAGYETTVPMTLDNMIYHAQSVTRAVKRALVLVDLPFGTYQGNSKEALCSAVRIMKETEAGAVKLEGGKEILESVDRILSAGIPVMGHLGLTPQSIHKYGTYNVRAKEEAEAQKLIQDAHLLEEAGPRGVGETGRRGNAAVWTELPRGWRGELDQWRIARSLPAVSCAHLSSPFLGGEAARPGGQNHPRLCNKFEASLGYLRPCLPCDLTTTTRIRVL